MSYMHKSSLGEIAVSRYVLIPFFSLVYPLFSTFCVTFLPFLRNQTKQLLWQKDTCFLK